MICSASGENVYYYTMSSAEDYLKNVYGSTVKNVKEKNTDKISDYNKTHNYSQSTLNAYYNNKNGLTPTSSRYLNGSCVLVASLTLVNFSREVLNEFSTADTDNDMFVKITDKCYDKNHIGSGGGAKLLIVNNCVMDAFDAYGVSKDASTGLFGLINKINDSIDDDKPMLLVIKDHAVVAVGTTSYEFEYTVTKTKGILWWKKTYRETITATEDFVIVSEGWGRTAKSIVPTSMITNYFYSNIVVKIKW